MEHSYYNRRKMLKRGIAGLVTLPLLDLAACSSDTTPSTMSSASLSTAPATLRLFFWGSARRNTLTGQAISLFQQSHRNVSITSRYSGYDVYYPQLDAQIASGNTPDLIQMDIRYIAKYVREGVFLDLTQFIYSQAINLSTFDPVLLNSSKMNNTIYGIPLGSNYECMIYDQTLLEKSGVGPLPANMNWDTFAAYTTEISKAFGNTTYGTVDGSGNYDTFEIWIRGRAKELYTRDGHLNFGLQDVVDWYSYWSNLRKVNACLPMHSQAKLDLTGTPVDSSVIQGKAIFSHIFSNQYEVFQNATSHTLALTPYPQGSTTGLYLKPSLVLGIAANSRYQFDAASFISFVINDPVAVKALGFERGVPGSAASLALLKPLLTPSQQVISAFMNKVTAAGDMRPKEVLDPPAAGQISDILQQVALKIGFGKTSVADGARELYTAASKATA